MNGTERESGMAHEPLLATETKTTLVFMLLGLTAWYLVRIFAASDVLELGALLGVGVVLPLDINEARRRSGTE
jgi:thiol:disulfide interchange protein